MFKILDKVCKPTKGSKYSACVDLYAREAVVIGAGETVLVGLGVKIDLEELLNNANCMSDENFIKSHQLNLHIRSSMSAKHGLIIANGTGIIDFDYEGEIMICLHKPFSTHGFDIASRIMLIGLECAKENVSKEETEILQKEFIEPHKKDLQTIIKKGQKIAQINLVEHKTYLLGVETDEERKGGFGSTDL